jgi:hypothetical protein
MLGKRSAGEDLPPAGRRPPPPEPRTLAPLSTSDIDPDAEFDDGTNWLNETRRLPVEFEEAEKSSFVFAGSTGIELLSP